MKKIEFLPNELWYGGAVFHADRYPISDKDEYELDTAFNRTSNQLNPVFLSNKGRYIWLENGGLVKFNRGVIEIDSTDIELNNAGKTLRDAALAAAKKHYPATGTTPDKVAFTAPQYCSWVVYLWSQNQEGILSYARSIVEKGYKPGLLIIDDTWQTDYGVWEFNKSDFPDPDAMMKELKKLGFSVSMWMAPYVSPDVPYKTKDGPNIWAHIKNKRILMDGEKPHLAYWWEGFSAMLDFRNQSAVDWFNAEVERLENKYGIAGLKLDGGDPIYTGEDVKDATLISQLYIDKVKNPLKEARSCYKLAGKPIIQRLNDKIHIWESEDYRLGLSSLIPGILTQGLIGYYYSCPDMVGGGSSADFVDKSGLDGELIIRWCQASILMPMVQFSYDVWNHPENRIAECCKKAMNLREKLLPYIVEVIENASKTNVPPVRYLDYEFPNEGFENTLDMFMLGDRYLVAPVLKKGATDRKVKFPSGKWRDIENGEIFSQGEFTVSAPLDKLPVFKRVE